MIFLALVLALETDLPACRADSVNCNATPCVAGSIDSLHVYGNGALLGSFGVRGQDGTLWQGQVELTNPDTTWQLWTVVQGTNRRLSCPSDTLIWPQVTDVPPAPSTGFRQIYDVSGRRVARPLRSGVYWTGNRQRITVWR